MKYIFLFLIISIPSFAHLGSVKGKVVENKNRLPMRGATVFIEELHIGSITDESGSFFIKEIPAGEYNIRVSLIGYAYKQEKIKVSNDEIKVLDFSLDISEISLSEIRVSAANPQKQQLINSLDIKLRPIQNSQEVLRIIPGLVMGQHAGGGKAEQIFLRGFDIDHGTDIALSVDGMPINMVSHAHGQGYADSHFIIPEMIEEVDFKKGMYDTEKGNFATAGWANFKTKRILDEDFIKAEIGQFNTYRFVGAQNLLKETNKNSLYMAGEYNYSDAFFESPQHFKRLNFMSKYHGHLSKNTNLTLSASTFKSNWDASGQIPDRAVETGQIGYFGAIDPTEGGQTSRTNLNAEFLTLTKKDIVWKNQVYYSKYDFELFSNFTFFLADPVNGDQIKQKENRSLWGYSSNASLSHSIAQKQSTFSAGLQYRQDKTTDSELSRTLSKIEILERLKFGNINELNVSIFAEEEIALSSKLSMIIGLRYEVFRNSYLDKLENQQSSLVKSQIVLPKFNLYYTANKNLQFYLNSGKGFHSNDSRAVVTQNGLLTLPGAYGLDLGTLWKPNKKVVFNAAFWNLYLDQEFVYVGDAAIVEASGKSNRAGFDLSFRYQLTNNLFIDSDVNWAKPRALTEPAGQNYIPLAVKFTSIGGFTLKNKNGLSGSLRYRYVADRPANEDNSIVAKGYFVNDALVNFNKGRFNYGLSIQNIFNVKWKETQFATESRLFEESTPSEEIHFTPGTPFNAKLSLMIRI